MKSRLLTDYTLKIALRDFFLLTNLYEFVFVLYALLVLIIAEFRRGSHCFSVGIRP